MRSFFSFSLFLFRTSALHHNCQREFKNYFMMANCSYVGRLHHSPSFDSAFTKVSGTSGLHGDVSYFGCKLRLSVTYKICSWETDYIPTTNTNDSIAGFQHIIITTKNAERIITSVEVDCEFYRSIIVLCRRQHSLPFISFIIIPIAAAKGPNICFWSLPRKKEAAIVCFFPSFTRVAVQRLYLFTVHLACFLPTVSWNVRRSVSSKVSQRCSC